MPVKIKTISGIDVVDTDRKATDEVSELKQNTTVSMDFGKLSFSPEMSLHIYGTPGQSRFNFMWDMLIEKADVYILLVAANRPSEFHHARRIMNFMNQRVSIPMLIGVTHSDSPGAWNVENVALALGYLSDAERPPIVPVNPNDRDSVAEAIVTLLETAFAGAEEEFEAESPEELAV